MTRMLLRRPYTIAFTAILLGMGIGGALRTESEWHEVYIASARALLRGHDLFGAKANTYPPFCAFFHLSFVALPPAVARVLWVLITIGCTVYFVRKSWQLSAGMKLEN